MKTRRFTLIELLVIISIIAILAALLLPVLASAKYRAKLGVCSSNLRQTAMSAFLYASDNDRRYPYRKAIRGTKSHEYSTPYMVRWKNDAATDDIATFRSLQLEDIPCPFTKIDWNYTGSSRHAGYSYYWGWTVIDSGYPECSLLKVGDKMKYKGDTFDIMASDILHQRERFGTQYVGHPDYGTNILTFKGGWWLSKNKAGRGSLDMNFCRTDGSVFRLNGLSSGTDSRLRRLPYKNHHEVGNLTDDNQLLPPAE